MFSGVEKECIWNKWVNAIMLDREIQEISSSLD